MRLIEQMSIVTEFMRGGALHNLLHNNARHATNYNDAVHVHFALAR